MRAAQQGATAGGGGPVKYLAEHSNRVYVADPHGDAGSGSEGLYADEVRVLRRRRMQVNGQRPALLGGAQPTAAGVTGRRASAGLGSGSDVDPGQ